MAVTCFVVTCAGGEGPDSSAHWAWARAAHRLGFGTGFGTLNLDYKDPAADGRRARMQLSSS